MSLKAVLKKKVYINEKNKHFCSFCAYINDARSLFNKVNPLTKVYFLIKQVLEKQKALKRLKKKHMIRLKLLKRKNIKRRKRKRKILAVLNKAVL